MYTLITQCREKLQRSNLWCLSDPPVDCLTADLLVYNPRLLSLGLYPFLFLFKFVSKFFDIPSFNTVELADASPLLRLPATHIAPDRLGKPYRDLKGKISRTTHTPGSRIGIYRLLYIVHTFSCRSLHRTHSPHSPD